MKGKEGIKDGVKCIGLLCGDYQGFSPGLQINEATFLRMLFEFYECFLSFKKVVLIVSEGCMFRLFSEDFQQIPSGRGCVHCFTGLLCIAKIVQ